MNAVNSVNGWIVQVLVTTTICAASLTAYEKLVREPRTPRLAIVDISRLYAAADQTLKDRVLNRSGEGAAPRAEGQDGEAKRLLRPEDFGPRLQGVLEALSSECRCAIVAMATVIGADSTVPDFTVEASRRMGVRLAGVAP